MHCSGMLWHPDVATQLVLASEDDRLPVIQMWDLRFATSPLKVLENHTRGILSISWSQADSELLLSSAKDNRILCWNPNTGEVHDLNYCSCIRDSASVWQACKLLSYSTLLGSVSLRGFTHINQLFRTIVFKVKKKIPRQILSRNIILPFKLTSIHLWDKLHLIAS